MKIVINTHHSSREEVEELRAYLDENCWDTKDENEDGKTEPYKVQDK